MRTARQLADELDRDGYREAADCVHDLVALAQAYRDVCAAYRMIRRPPESAVDTITRLRWRIEGR